jgi:uncharacterized membrane protein YhaH (DUF805 family)
MEYTILFFNAYNNVVKNMGQDTALLLDELKDLKDSDFFYLLFIIATLIGIKRNDLLRKDLLNIIDVNPNDIKQIEIIIATLLIISRIYFLILNFKSYLNEPNKYNLYYVLGSFLLVGATAITLITTIIEPVGEDENEMID